MCSCVGDSLLLLGLQKERSRPKVGPEGSGDWGRQVHGLAPSSHLRKEKDREGWEEEKDFASCTCTMASGGEEAEQFQLFRSLSQWRIIAVQADVGGSNRR